MKTQSSQYKKFLILWAGEFISSIGGGLTSFGLGVYVFKLTNSAASMALVTLLAFLPTLLLSAPAGVLADRYDRRKLMMIGDGCSGLGILFILICMLCGEASLFQIGIGVLISSVFSALLEPSYRATITDLLTPEEYSKASGMVGLAGSARYLIAPVLAGELLVISDIRLILAIDISTFLITVCSTMVVKKSIQTKERENSDSFLQNFRDGFAAITQNKGVFSLIMVSSLLTCFMGTLQILSEPMILDFADSRTLGIAETVCAMGMLVSSLYLGIKGMKKGYVKVLSISLCVAGLAMIGFGFLENIYWICCFGFLFFLALPFANNCLDYLVRTNIDESLQGRAWGMIGFLSQIGCVVAYGFAGLAADGVAKVRQIGVGRGAAEIIMIAGVLLSVTSIAMYGIKQIRTLGGNQCIEKC